MKRRWQVGCPCCDPCRIDWFAPSVEISTANATTIRSAVHPQSPYPSWLRVDVKAETTAIVRLFVLWDDSTPGDGIYVEFTPDSPTSEAGTINVYTKDDTLIAGPWYVYGGVSDAWHTITLCYDPDTDPEEMVITFEPAGTYYDTTPTQAFNVLLPDTFTVGTKAGYGSGAGSGSVWFKDYTFDRLWYCGSSPYASDCHESLDDWDEYNTLPARTICHPCTRCPSGPSTLQTSNWRQLAGTWAFSSSGALLTGTDGKAVSYAGQSAFEVCATATVRTYAANDQGIVGMSDILGRNQLYLVVSKSDASSGTIPVGVYYDEVYDRFYWWIARVGTASVTYSIYRVTDGGSPSLEAGPTTITEVGGVVFGDGYVTVHAKMRNWLIGSGGTNASGVLHGGVRNQCSCGGGTDGYEESPKSRKYSAAVSGIVAGATPLSGTTYADVTRLNRSVTLRNYYHLSPGSPFNAPCANCCHSEWAVDTGSKLTWFRAKRETDTTELIGYAYTQQSTPGGLVAVEVKFSKSIYGKVELRDLSGEVLTFDSVQPDLGYVDASAATFMITAVV
jgi:hypothetical protein